MSSFVVAEGYHLVVFSTSFQVDFDVIEYRKRPLVAGFHNLSANTCVNCQLLLVASERKQISLFLQKSANSDCCWGTYLAFCPIHERVYRV